MSVWISDEKLHIFASLISPSKMILFEKKYQTFDTVFHHQMKHCISCLIVLHEISKICFLLYRVHLFRRSVTGIPPVYPVNTG